MDRSKWEYKKLGEVCTLLNGFAFKSDKYVDNGIRVMRITNVQKGEIVDDDPKYYPISSQSEILRYMLKENDLLLSLTGNVGRVGLLRRELLPAALNQRVACLRIKNKAIDLKFIFHLMNSDLFESECIANSQGIAQKNLSTKWLENYKLPVPPIADQQRIVAELDCLNEMIALKQEQLKEFDKLAQSIFYDMFGDPITNSKNWSTIKLEKITKAEGGGTPSKSNPNYWDGDVVWVTSKDMKQMYISDSQIHITEEGLNNSSAHILPKETILLVNRSGILKHTLPLAITTREVSINQDLKALTIKDKCFISIYILYVLKAFAPYLLSKVKAVTVDSIEFSIFKNLDIPISPLALQQQFAEKIQAIEAQKELVKKSIVETQHLLDSRMDYYFN